MKTASELLTDACNPVIDVIPNNGGDSELTSDYTDVIPSLKDRPKYVVLDDWHESGGTKYRPGVWYFAVKETKEGFIPLQTWICSPLHIEAITSNGHGDHFGRLLRFINTLGVWREWAMPMELLRAAGKNCAAHCSAWAWR